MLRSHYAGDWVIPSQEGRNDLDKMNALGRAYATAPDGADKENKLFAIQEAFHGYLMKYLVMILRGTIPPGGSRAGRESHVFLRMLMPRGAEPTSDEYSESCKKLHLAFKKDTTEDVYDTLVLCFLRACRRFDPHYADKVRQVCEVIDALSGQFTAEQVTARVGFDSSRILRSLVRKEFLSSVTGKKKVVGYKRAAWPAPASFFESGPVGFVYALQTWFRYFLNEYISKQMDELEAVKLTVVCT